MLWLAWLARDIGFLDLYARRLPDMFLQAVNDILIEHFVYLVR
jgi:hypothetical protein